MNLFKSLATVSGFTMLSRVTGLARETITASLFGASALTDAFFVAFRLPNLLRRLFAEGAFSQAFVPLLSQAKESSDKDAQRVLIDHVASALFWSLLMVTIIGIIGAPTLVYMMASGLEGQSQQAAIVMTRWMFPYILMISLVAFSSGILNTWKKFALPAFSPVLLNLSFIACSLLLDKFFNPPIYALAAGVVLGGIAQLAIQIPALLRLGMLPKIQLNPIKAFQSADVKNVMRLMAPALLSVGVAQLSLVINTQIASRLAPGSVSWINYADRLMEFPTALLGVALGVVLLPSLSRAHQKGLSQEYSDLLDWGLRLSLLLALPAMAGLWLLAEPLTALLFHRGLFTDTDVRMTSMAVVGYSFGILGLVSLKILAPGFFARQDTRTPVRIAICVLVITQVLNYLLLPYFSHVALTMSISIGAWINALWMLSALYKIGVYKPRAGWLVFALTIFAAAAVMAFAISLTTNRIDWIALQASPFKRAALGLAIISAAMAIYGGFLLLCGIKPADFMRKE